MFTPTKPAGLLLAFSTLARHASALDFNICADFNTASGSTNTSNLQSNGLCSDFCRSSYVFAITSHESCWCSNYEPANGNVLDKKNCDFPCPGYPFEYCGGKSKNTFGYISLGPQPSGTKGSGGDGSSSATSTTPSSKSTQQPSSSVLSTVTVGGRVTTVIVVPTSTGDTSQDNKPVPSGSSGLGGGAIAGIAIGSIAAVALVGLLIWFIIRRRKQNDDELRDDPSVRGSSRGRMGSHQQDLSIAGSAASPGSAGNRNSMLQVDPRMDPFKQGLYMRNGSAESINTLRDEHDYSRRIQQPKVLRATNPDPDS
ncbi:Carbohydrate-binding WSC [Cordyceps fumosorosea ARSEF 2679]|uniref:Carbohydrate-binding WSC n=1 Tax=Cordyceps fumosorosea (strain ARSEF 2679) TaxID=1081104 RepID=A0A167R6Z3_CORFA|nr:Carbohydrate-binding WSC [Cordyceps fumosorosea ARSEF 2679]OAA58329.1 Carbohydrate-binding WSC [Cordyceps fumosorosea ARSEF 2679]